jgi:hypothetical protein
LRSNLVPARANWAPPALFPETTVSHVGTGLISIRLITRLPVTGFACQNPKIKETLVLKSSRSRAILGALDILVDIGVPAEKEVIL